MNTEQTKVCQYVTILTMELLLLLQSLRLHAPGKRTWVELSCSSWQTLWYVRPFKPHTWLEVLLVTGHFNIVALTENKQQNRTDYVLSFDVFSMVMHNAYRFISYANLFYSVPSLATYHCLQYCMKINTHCIHMWSCDMYLLHFLKSSGEQLLSVEHAVASGKQR